MTTECSRILQLLSENVVGATILRSVEVPPNDHAFCFFGKPIQLTALLYPKDWKDIYLFVTQCALEERSKQSETRVPLDISCRRLSGCSGALVRTTKDRLPLCAWHVVEQAPDIREVADVQTTEWVPKGGITRDLQLITPMWKAFVMDKPNLEYPPRCPARSVVLKFPKCIVVETP